MSINKSILAFAAVLSTAAVVQSAHATPETDVPQMTVRYGDLNLATPSGVAALYSRLQSASANACDAFVAGNSISDRRIAASCRSDLVSKAVVALHAPALSALAAGDPKPMQVASH